MGKIKPQRHIKRGDDSAGLIPGKQEAKKSRAHAASPPSALVKSHPARLEIACFTFSETILTRAVASWIFTL
jgi:hypothetical protein